MYNRLYVGNLAYDVSREALNARFAEYGEVTETLIVKDRENHRPRGFAFVTMRTEADAMYVIAQLNGAMFEGRPLRVNAAEGSASRGSDHHAYGDCGW
jgi:RNA recognition motif-containing protein